MSHQSPVERIEPQSKNNSLKSWSYEFEGRPSWLTENLLKIGCRLSCAVIFGMFVLGCVGCYKVFESLPK